MGHKPFALFLLAGFLALPLACGDDDDNVGTGGKGGTAGTGGNKGGTGGTGGTKGGTGGTSGTTGGRTSGGSSGTTGGAVNGGGGSSGGSRPTGGTGGTDGGAGASGAETGGTAGSGPIGGEGGGGVTGTGGVGEGGGGAGGQGGTDGGAGAGGGGSVLRAQVEALSTAVCGKQPGGVSCANNDNCVAYVGQLDEFNAAGEDECDELLVDYLNCMNARPISEYQCDGDNGLDIFGAGADGSCADQTGALGPCAG